MQNTPEKQNTTNQKDDAKKSSAGLIALASIAGLILLSLVGYFFIWPLLSKDRATTPAITEKNAFPIAQTDQAKQPPTPSSTTPTQPPPVEPTTYTNLEQEFPELINAKYGLFSPRAKELLKNNKFVAVPGATEQFFNTYKTNTEQHIPNFITTDSLLHTTHLVFKHLGQKINEDKVTTADILTNMAKKMNLEKNN